MLANYSWIPQVSTIIQIASLTYRDTHKGLSNLQLCTGEYKANKKMLISMKTIVEFQSISGEIQASTFQSRLLNEHTQRLFDIL